MPKSFAPKLDLRPNLTHPRPTFRSSQEAVSDPADGGDSEYNIITCLQCSAEVGKVYVRTSQENAKLQDLISLSTEAVCSYQLGRHEMRVQGAGDMNPLSEERVTRLEEQMVKVENVLVLFNERWHAMESALRQLQQRVDVVSTPSQQHGMAWGMGPGVSPNGGGGASGGRGGGGVGMPMLPGEVGRGGGGVGGGQGGGSPFGGSDQGGPGSGFRGAAAGAAAAMYGSRGY